MGAYGGPNNCGWTSSKPSIGEIANYLLGRTASPPAQADQNSDGKIDAADIIYLVND